MKALIFSDTHGKVSKAIDIINSHKDVDLIIHLGDLVRDAEDLEIIFNNKRSEYVSGNNDFFNKELDEKIIEFGSKKILITHGHKYKVHFGMSKIIKQTKEMKIDAVLFGHTHVSINEIIDNKLYLNPGSLTRPRDGQASYGLLEINNDKLNSMICKI